MPELLVIGTSGLAKEMAQLARQIDPSGERWPSISYVAQDSRERGRQLPYGRVEHTDADLAARPREADVVLGIGHPRARLAVGRRLQADAPGLRFPNLVSPGVVVDEAHVRMGVGNVFTRGVVLTVDIVIGDFNLFNWQVTVGHDVRVGSGCVANPGAAISGWCTVGDECLLGTGARIVERLDVAEGVTVGAGAVVTRSIAHRGVYIGIPARRRGD